MEFNEVVVLVPGQTVPVGEIEFRKDAAEPIYRPVTSAFRPDARATLEQIAPTIRDQIERGQVCGDADGLRWHEGNFR